MCIRDRQDADLEQFSRKEKIRLGELDYKNYVANILGNIFCLLYTSDAADERSSVDLGGRRIIKKKKN